jgi:hypothetical protein
MRVTLLIAASTEMAAMEPGAAALATAGGVSPLR